MTPTEFDKIVERAPKDATHYSEFRNEYYCVRDSFTQLWDQYNKAWVIDHRYPNINKWIALATDVNYFNDGHWLEGLDRTHTIMIMIEQLLGNGDSYHPSIKRARLEKKVDKLAKRAMDLYQALGAAADEEMHE